MARDRRTAKDGARPPQRELPIPGTGAVPAPPDVDALAARLAAAVAAIPDLAARVGALNRARAALHAVSPFAREPVDLVEWVPAAQLTGNDYNPNAVAPPEMELLRLSVEADGYTQPIVAHALPATADDPARDEIVDGFHRHRVGREVAGVRERVHGYLPVTRINVDRAGRTDRIAATVRHNRARGVHGVDRMSALVRMLYVAGWDDAKIATELGMEGDEVLRLKQITGLAALFAQRAYSEAWEPDVPRRGRRSGLATIAARGEGTPDGGRDDGRE